MDDGVPNGVTTPLQPGDPRRLGAYELLGRLGVGGQGAVFLGTTGSGQQVAIKLLHPELLDNTAARGRFIREAIAAKKVARFCAAQVLDVDMAGDRPYIVSEYVPGPSLQAVVAEQGPITGGALDRLAIGIATALVAIHQVGIVHRDLKPANVLIGPDGPRVIDFGIARALDTPSATSSRGVGTPGYMAPEQLRGEDVSAAADIFAWGATIGYAATGRSPFGSDSVGAVLMRCLSEPPDLAGLSGPLRDMVDAALDKNPANRPPARGLLLRMLGHEETQAPAEMMAEGATMAARRTPPHGTPVQHQAQPYGGQVAPVDFSQQETHAAAHASTRPQQGSLDWQSTSPGAPETTRRRRGRVAALAVAATVLVTAAILVGTMLVAGLGSGKGGGGAGTTTAPAGAVTSGVDPNGGVVPVTSSSVPVRSNTPTGGTTYSQVTCWNGTKADSYDQCPARPRPSCPSGKVKDSSTGNCVPSPCPEGTTRGSDGTCHSPEPSHCDPPGVLQPDHSCVTPPTEDPCTSSNPPSTCGPQPGTTRGRNHQPKPQTSTSSQ
jgi:eukaryotic-like serine/threonine-protein kinase